MIPDNARAVVTGAGSGLGRAFATELAARGARLLLSDVDETGLAETVALVGGAAESMRCDVSRAEEVEAMAARADALWGGVDVVVNNAGVATGGNVGEVPLDDWRWLFGVNFWGVVHGCHVFAPRLRRQGRGHILNVASAAGLLNPPGLGPYNTSKAAVISLSETLHAELRDAGVGVTVLCPTFFQTNIAKNARGSDRDPKMVPMIEKLMRGSKLQAADVARFALDCAARDELFALPHADGRWFWRLKRAVPSQYAALVPKVLARVRRRPAARA